jgi:hypothetical protein
MDYRRYSPKTKFSSYLFDFRGPGSKRNLPKNGFYEVKMRVVFLEIASSIYVLYHHKSQHENLAFLVLFFMTKTTKNSLQAINSKSCLLCAAP